MFENAIVDRINKGWLLFICLLPFVCIGAFMNRVALTISLLLIWFTPITLFILDQIPKNLFDIEKKIGYEISRGAIYLLAIQYYLLLFWDTILLALTEYRAVLFWLNYAQPL